MLTAGKRIDAEDVGSGQKKGDEGEHGAAFGVEKLAGFERQREQDQEVGAVGEEHLPLEGGDGAHSDETEEDEEIAVGFGGPEIAAGIAGQQPEGEHEAGHSAEAECADDGGFGFAFEGEGVVVEEAAEEVVAQDAGAGGEMGSFGC